MKIKDIAKTIAVVGFSEYVASLGVRQMLIGDFVGLGIGVLFIAVFGVLIPYTWINSLRKKKQEVNK
jgi:hypothetical protein